MCRAKITGVPSYISTILKMNCDNNKKMKDMEEELRIHHSNRSSPNVSEEAFLLLQRLLEIRRTMSTQTTSTQSSSRRTLGDRSTREIRRPRRTS